VTAPVLTSANTVTCNHAPAAPVKVETAAKLRVGSKPVLVVAETGPMVIPGTCVPTSQSDKPCLTVAALSKGPAAKLRADGHPVLLNTLAAQTDGVIKGVKGALKVVTTPEARLVAR